MDSYTTTVGKHRLRYELHGNELTCAAESQSGMTLKVDLSDPGTVITEKRAFHRAFWGGWVAIVGVAFMLEMIRAREGWEGITALGWSILLQGVLLAVGVVLVVRHCRPRGFTDVTVNREAGIVVWFDEDRADEYRAFVAELTRRARG